MLDQYESWYTAHTLERELALAEVEHLRRLGLFDAPPPARGPRARVAELLLALALWLDPRASERMAERPVPRHA
jgi:hypothetical protein